MNNKFTPERILEDRLIETLVAGGRWTYEPDLDSEDKLWANLKAILERNNMAELEGEGLSPKEFAQVKDQLTFSSFFKASLFLRGENGKVKVRVKREDATEVWLTVLDNRNIAGGSSVYQIINQYRAVGKRKLDGDSRFDVSLLINGLPLIHIELKNRAVAYMEAFYQIKDYVREGKFSGIYSACQMFVVTNGSDTRYIAAAGHEDLNAKFLTRWVDENNEPVTDYLDFARDVLSIPQAHRLIADYSVIDYDASRLILLRPYQIHAIRAVRRDLKEGSGGYVWHTTGSGKTLTSYKVAKNILDVPDLDKSVFIVDRIDLDNQTTSAFTSYAKGDYVDVDETDNVGDLVKKLSSDQKAVVVTTVQKLNYLIKRYEDKDSPRAKRLRDLSLVFVVDECHRAVSSEKMAEIDKFFRKTRWYGFTGTPIFAENSRAAKGDLARTTEDQYGRCLHEYTVRNAIMDKAVLGFQVEYRSTISEDGIFDILEDRDIDPRGLTEEEREARIPREIFETDRHMIQVVDTIVNKSRLKFGLDRASGKSFSAILTTSSIAKAQRYYELFSDLKEGKLDIKISDRVKKLVPDFPKVAITYSIAVNQEETGADKEKMKKALADYNQTFGTGFGLDSIGAYNQNLNDRLARKKDTYKVRSEQVDLVIVVDRLLTGFDSPSTALLFIDRPPMTAQNLIQAFSRTNRIYDKYKNFGQIVTFQTPALYKKAIDEAFRLYSNGGEKYIEAPTYEESLEEFETALENFRDLVKSPEDIDKLAGLEEKKAFVRAFQRLDRAMANIRVYGAYDEEAFSKRYNLDQKEWEEINGKYENVKKDLKEQRDEDEGEADEDLDLVDISYESLTVGRLEVGFEYLDSLLDVAKKEAQGKNKDEIEKMAPVKELLELIEKAKTTNPKKASLYETMARDIIANPNKYKDINMGELMAEISYEHFLKGVDKLAEAIKVPVDDVMFYIESFDVNKDANKQDNARIIVERSNLEALKKETGLGPLKAKKYIRTQAYEIAKEDTVPYR